MRAGSGQNARCVCLRERVPKRGRLHDLFEDAIQELASVELLDGWMRKIVDNRSGRPVDETAYKAETEGPRNCAQGVRGRNQLLDTLWRIFLYAQCFQESIGIRCRFELAMPKDNSVKELCEACDSLRSSLVVGYEQADREYTVNNAVIDLAKKKSELLNAFASTSYTNGLLLAGAASSGTRLQLSCDKGCTK